MDMIRKFFIAALVTGASSVGCTSEETVTRPPTPPVNWAPVVHTDTTTGAGRATAKERGAAEAYAKALGDASLEKLNTVLDEDAHFSFVGMRDAHGRDKVIEAHQKLFSAFDGRTFAPTRVWLTDAAQVVEWTMKGTHAREWMGVAATNKPVVIRGISLLWTRDDGSVTDVHVVFDEEVVRAQLGAGHKELAALPAPPADTAPRVDVEQTRTPEEAANVAAVRASLNALENGKETVYLDSFADDVELWNAERAEPAHGKAEMRSYYKSSRKALAELDTAVDNAFGVGPFVLVEYDVIGTQTTPIGWIPMQHDKLLKFTVVDVAEMRAGKIARVWRYDNPGQVIEKP